MKTSPLPQNEPQPKTRRRLSDRTVGLITSVLTIVSCLLLLFNVGVTTFPSAFHGEGVGTKKPTRRPTVAPTPSPTPTFDPTLGAVLPSHRIIAFYAVPGAEPTGPA